LPAIASCNTGDASVSGKVSAENSKTNLLQTAMVIAELYSAWRRELLLKRLLALPIVDGISGLLIRSLYTKRGHEKPSKTIKSKRTVLDEDA